MRAFFRREMKKEFLELLRQHGFSNWREFADKHKLPHKIPLSTRMERAFEILGIPE